MRFAEQLAHARAPKQVNLSQQLTYILYRWFHVVVVWQGVLSVFDPPRHDTKATIEAAFANGVEVKMITGDHTAIAVETCRMLGMGTKVCCHDGGL